MEVMFNREPVRLAGTIEPPDEAEVRATPPLFNASLEDALLYGGDLTRAALSAMRLRGDRRHILVDTKVHMLMAGMWPAIPGWHTDGVPRVEGVPHLALQEEMTAPRFHLLVTGRDALPEFRVGEETLELADEPSGDLYEQIHQAVEATQRWRIMSFPSCYVAEWDWWNLHRATAARARHWRFLIRVTETDHRAPKTDLREVLRTQQQAYVLAEAFGW